MRRSYAHDAVVALGPGDDVRAPGAAITVELCGRLDHPGPCPLAPHHTAAERAGDETRLRILFAVEPEREGEVRERIRASLAARWEVRRSEAGTVRAEETDHARRLAGEQRG